MKKLIIFCLSLLLLMESCEEGIIHSNDLAFEESKGKRQIADQPYYWSMGKKQYLDIDPHTIVIKSEVDSTKISILLSTISSDLVISKLNSDLFVLKSNKDFRDLTAQLARINEVKGIYSSYTVNDRSVVPTGEIILEPGKTNIESILSKYQERLMLIEKKEYNRFKLRVKNLSELLLISNEIYESGLVEWCHPNFISPIIFYAT